ncbi:hypothetical protein MRX96_037848 [Rhipicephalus microplus]
MEVTVNGRDADQEELESSDWVTKLSKRVAELQESQQRERNGATRAPSTSSGCGKEGRTMPAGFNGDKHGENDARLKRARSDTAGQTGFKIVRGANPSIEVDQEGARNPSPRLPPLEKPGVSHKASHDGGDCAQEKSKSTGPQVGWVTKVSQDANTEMNNAPKEQNRILQEQNAELRKQLDEITAHLTSKPGKALETPQVANQLPLKKKRAKETEIEENHGARIEALEVETKSYKVCSKLY